MKQYGSVENPKNKKTKPVYAKREWKFRSISFLAFHDLKKRLGEPCGAKKKSKILWRDLQSFFNKFDFQVGNFASGFLSGDANVDIGFFQ